MLSRIGWERESERIGKGIREVLATDLLGFRGEEKSIKGS